MLFIIEGFDNTGKTSLVNHLIRGHTVDGPSLVFHSNSKVKQWRRLEEIATSLGSGVTTQVICDRIGIIGEEVYGKALRGYSHFDLGLRGTWEEFFRILPGDELIIFIWCNPKYPVIGNKEEMEGVIENKDDLIKRYIEAMEATRKIFDEARELGYDTQFIEFDYQSDPQYKTLSHLTHRKEGN